MVQILYKVATAFAVGLQDKNPVVIANLGVVGLQLVTIGSIGSRWQNSI